MRSSPSERFARKLALAFQQWLGPHDWALSIVKETDWASATLEGFRMVLALRIADGVIPAGLAERLESLDLDMPSHFLGDIVAQPVEGGLTIKALLLKNA